MIQVKRVYNPRMTVFRYGRQHFEEGEYVRRLDARPGNDLDPVVRIVEDLGTVEIPCGKVDCRSNCIEYMVSAAKRRDDYALAECKISTLVSIIKLVSTSASFVAMKLPVERVACHACGATSTLPEMLKC